MSYMTRIPGYPDRDDVHAGMAHFAGGGPEGKTCESCKHRGYSRKGRDKFNPRTNLIEETHYHARGCRMFLKLHGQHGSPIRKDWRACRYYADRR